MPRTYLGYTRNRAKANLDALWAAIVESECESTAVIPLPDETAVMEPCFYGHTIVQATADIDALWAMLPGVQPAWPADSETRQYRGRASTAAMANLHALYALLRALTCCDEVPQTSYTLAAAPGEFFVNGVAAGLTVTEVEPPPACAKILDEVFDFEDRTAFLASWQERSRFIAADYRAKYDMEFDGETTRIFRIPSEPDQTPGTVFSIDFYPGVTPTIGAPVWMRVQVYLDEIPLTDTLNHAQSQIAFGGIADPLTQEWFAFATDPFLGGKFYTGLHWRSNLVPAYHQNHLGENYKFGSGLVGSPHDPGPGAGPAGFAVEPYSDGLATLWELVAHCQYDEDGVTRVRTFIGPVDGPKVPMSDARIYAPGMGTVVMPLGFTYFTHKTDGGIVRAPKLKRVEAWECPYISNPCDCDIVVPDPTGPVASLEIVNTTNLLLDDELELSEAIGVIARDADDNIIPGVRPEILTINRTGPGFIPGPYTWEQTVNCGSDEDVGEIVAWWPNGVQSPAVPTSSFEFVSRRYWVIRSNSQDNGRDLSIAGLEFRESLGGPDVSSGGTPIGSTPLAGTALADAYDGNGATYFTATGRPQEQFIGIDFGVGDERLIRQIKITARTDEPGLAPAHFSIYSSDDLLVWAQHQPYTNYQWTSGLALTFSVF